jgi:hypothetical protein
LAILEAALSTANCRRTHAIAKFRDLTLVEW